MESQFASGNCCLRSDVFYLPRRFYLSQIEREGFPALFENPYWRPGDYSAEWLLGSHDLQFVFPSRRIHKKIRKYLRIDLNGSRIILRDKNPSKQRADDSRFRY